MTERVRAVDLVDAIAEALYQVKSYELPEVCQKYGLAPGTEDEAHESKRWYVRKRLKRWELPGLVGVAVRVLEDYRSEELQELVRRAGTRGVDGDFKNIIFAAKGPKPELVLRDAVNNRIEIVKNAEYCLVYDRVLPSEGLSWAALVRWWCESQGRPTDDLIHPARLLYQRLYESLDPKSPPEQLFFKEYCALYGIHSIDKMPALIPQVYLHYDPYTRAHHAPGAAPLPRQRMDFLLLLPQRIRIVIECDGRQHYADEAGRADSQRYAEMVAEDRELRLRGYEVYRFGGAELTEGPVTDRRLAAFFDRLAERYAT